MSLVLTQMLNRVQHDRPVFAEVMETDMLSVTDSGSGAGMTDCLFAEEMRRKVSFRIYFGIYLCLQKVWKRLSLVLTQMLNRVQHDRPVFAEVMKTDMLSVTDSGSGAGMTGLCWQKKCDARCHSEFISESMFVCRRCEKD